MIPEGIRVYAIGDIHGRADLLQKMHTEIAAHAADAAPAENYIVYLGDYVDRGLQVKETIDMLAAGPPPGFVPVYLRGNHEEMLFAFLEDAGTLEYWMALGAGATLMSYGVAAPIRCGDAMRSNEVRQAFIEVFPESHHAFLSSLRPYYTAGDYLFVHAGIRPGVVFEKQKRQILHG